MRVLLSAFACHPGSGSEPSIGWELSRQLAKWHEVHVLTDPANRKGISEKLSKTSQPNVEFTYVSAGGFPAKLAWKPFSHHLYYLAWQIAAYRAARQLHAQRRFDVVHHATYVNSWLPTFMGDLGIPFIWNAGPRETSPLHFLRSMSWRSGLAEIARTFAMLICGGFTHWRTATKANLILSGSPASSWPSQLPLRRWPVGGLPTEEVRFLTELELRSLLL